MQVFTITHISWNYANSLQQHISATLIYSLAEFETHTLFTHTRWYERFAMSSANYDLTQCEHIQRHLIYSIPYCRLASYAAWIN